MEDEEVEFDISDHLEKCRLCLTSINESDVFYKTTEKTRENFEKFTNLEFKFSSDLSSLVCLSCNRDLSRCIAFREKLIRKQTKLYEFVYNDENVDGLVDDEEDVLFEANEEEIECGNTSDYLIEDIPSVMEEADTDGEEIVEIDETFAENCFVETEDDCIQETTAGKKISRPKAWTWTTQMEIDLLRYRNRYKTEKTSDNFVYAKISKKFQSRESPISRKSIKYKYEKLLTEPAKLKELLQQANNDPITESDDELDVEERETHRRISARKSYFAWNEDIEVLLISFVLRIKEQNPAISDNALYRKITKEMELQGHSKISEHVIIYHYKKLKQDEEKFERLISLAKARQNSAFSSCYQWSDEADAALLKYNEMFHGKTNSGEIWAKIAQRLTKDGFGCLSASSIKNRFSALCEHKGEETTCGETLEKRNYLHWTNEMKEALIAHRKSLMKRSAPSQLWENVAKQMKADGFGTFTAKNVKYKYFNLKRKVKNKPVELTFEVDEM